MANEYADINDDQIIGDLPDYWSRVDYNRLCAKRLCAGLLFSLCVCIFVAANLGCWAFVIWLIFRVIENTN